MNRPQLEHVIRSAAAISGEESIVVIGSQAILGQFPDAPADLVASLEADVFTFGGDAVSDLIDGSIGEGSPFHETFGYYAHGVSEETAVLPSGWKERLVPIRNENTGGASGLCLEVHDLAISKLVAAREKDLDFVSVLLRHGLASVRTIHDRLQTTALEPEALDRALARLEILARPRP